MWMIDASPITAGKQHFPPTKIQRMCIYGTPYSHPECRIYYMEYRNDTFLKFLEGENVSEPAVHISVYGKAENLKPKKLVP